MRVELLFDRECPNVAATRERLSLALQAARLPLSWIEWDQRLPGVPSHVRSFGSPTVLIEGRDVDGLEPGCDSSCCRLYECAENRTSGIPSVALIQAALLQAAPLNRGRTPKRNLLTLPGILLSVLRIGGCPACWPVYAGILSSLGLSFLLSSHYLVPLTALFLLIALFTLGFRARTRRGYGPFAAGLIAAALILGGKFSLEANALAYFGLALLISSSFWNSWPQKTVAARCPKCAPSDAELIN
jgi:mercuric ion transport protein